MKIAFHGGKCCGIKTIYLMGNEPDDKDDAIDNPKPLTNAAANPDQEGCEVSSTQNFFYGKAPKETYLERLDRYIAYLDKVRPNGIIEICLSDYGCYKPSTLYDQIPAWDPLLIERGFVVVNSCHNSNSNNRVFVYHRKTDKE